jgi:hypothetical protein
MIGYMLPEIRRLLISLIQSRVPDPNASGPGQPGDGDASTKSGSATTDAAAMRSPNSVAVLGIADFC